MNWATALGAYVTALGAVVVAIIAWRSQRRLVAANARKVNAEADIADDERNRLLRKDLDEEYAKRVDVTEELKDERAKREGLAAELDAEKRERAAETAVLRLRIERLEAQVISLGGTPINGG